MAPLAKWRHINIVAVTRRSVSRIPRVNPGDAPCRAAIGLAGCLETGVTAQWLASQRCRQSRRDTAGGVFVYLAFSSTMSRWNRWHKDISKGDSISNWRDTRNTFEPWVSMLYMSELDTFLNWPQDYHKAMHALTGILHEVVVPWSHVFHEIFFIRICTF